MSSSASFYRTPPSAAPDPSRRRLLGAASIIAAASAAAVLPSAAQAVPVAATHPGHVTGAAWRSLYDQLNPEQRDLLHVAMIEDGDSWQRDGDSLVNELCRHAPGLAPMIRTT